MANRPEMVQSETEYLNHISLIGMSHVRSLIDGWLLVDEEMIWLNIQGNKIVGAVRFVRGLFIFSREKRCERPGKRKNVKIRQFCSSWNYPEKLAPSPSHRAKVWLLRTIPFLTETKNIKSTVFSRNKFTHANTHTIYHSNKHECKQKTHMYLVHTPEHIHHTHPTFFHLLHIWRFKRAEFIVKFNWHLFDTMCCANNLAGGREERWQIVELAANCVVVALIDSDTDKKYGWGANIWATRG